MGLLDHLTHHPAAPAPDFQTVGDQPGPNARVRHELHSDAQVATAVEHDDAARVAHATRPPVQTHPVPIVVAEHLTADEWTAEQVSLQPGEVRPIVGRDPQRVSVELLQTTNVRVAITTSEQDAQSASTAVKFPPPRSALVPGGGTVFKKLTVTGAVWAVCDPAAGGPAQLDVTVERQHRPTRP